jgi:hypothetical protein
MRMDTAFPSKYLKAADLESKPSWRMKISHVEMEQVNRSGDKSPVLYFRGARKGLALNKTNNNKLCEHYGNDSDDWEGKEIDLVVRMVDYQGDEVPAIRIQIPNKKRSDHQAPARDHVEAAERDRGSHLSGDPIDDDKPRESKREQKFDKELDDEIPF